MFLSIGATVQLTNTSSFSLIEGNYIYLCVEIDMEDLALLRRMVTINVKSYETSMSGKGETEGR